MNETTNPQPSTSKTTTAESPSAALRDLPGTLELTDEQYGKIVKKTGADKKPRRKWPVQCVNAHKDILEMLKNGVTVRVIHMKVGMSRTTVYEYIQGHADLREAYRDAQEDLLDLAEETVNEVMTMDCEMEHTENGNFPRYDGRSLGTKFNAAKLRLERLGGKRGWNPKLETNEVGGGMGRNPVIFMGQFTEEMIAESEAEIRRTNEEALKGLEGIPLG